MFKLTGILFGAQILILREVDLYGFLLCCKCLRLYMLDVAELCICKCIVIVSLLACKQLTSKTI